MNTRHPEVNRTNNGGTKYTEKVNQRIHPVPRPGIKRKIETALFPSHSVLLRGQLDAMSFSRTRPNHHKIREMPHRHCTKPAPPRKHANWSQPHSLSERVQYRVGGESRKIATQSVQKMKWPLNGTSTVLLHSHSHCHCHCLSTH